MKPTLRRRFLARKRERPLEDYKVIGHRWKRSNVCSLMILIGRKLDFRPKTKRGTVRVPNEMIVPSYTVVSVRKALLYITLFTICGGDSLRDPPVPIPNTEVKPQHVKGTWLVTARESRSPPHST